jgi:hypothetical protein
MVNKRILIMIGAALVVIVVGGAWLRNLNKPSVNLSFTEASLNSLESKIYKLSYEDLEGLTSKNASLFQFSSVDIDQLGEKLLNLSYEDLEGLTTP